MTVEGPEHPRPGLVLIGYRGTGKSTVGRIVAERSRRPFADADIELERSSGRSIRSIFERDGEPAFRALETEVLLRLAASSRLAGGVLATGGGAVLREANRRAIRQFGLVVWLTADAETLARRLSGSRHAGVDRPALTAAGTSAEVADVLEARTPIYRQVADFEVVSAGRSVFEVAESVLEVWKKAMAARVVSEKGDR